MTQALALDILKTGVSVFLTGEPGSGKSHTIHSYVSYLHSCGVSPVVTATTGIAATHIGGITIHSWSGIGVKKTLSPYELDTLVSTEYIHKRIKNTSVLIIDEISMIDAQTLDTISNICSAVKGIPEPFGGIQVIMVGDFFQLPPVSKGERVSFAYNALSWKTLKPLVCYLSEQHRQEDPGLLEVLKAIRSQSVDELHYEHITSRMVQPASSGITKLYAKNIDVDVINAQELENIPEKEFVFRMEQKGNPKLVASLIKGCLSPEILTLKVGAKVMCTKNNQAQKYANGTIGVVIGFAANTHYPIIKTHAGHTISMEPAEWVIEENGVIKASIMQIPLRLAWAMTIHKSQGISLDTALVSLGEVFEYGQGYVALSRVRTLKGLYVEGINRRALEVHPEVSEQDQIFMHASTRAEEYFAQMKKEEITTLHQKFLTHIGGVSGTTREKIVKTDTIQQTLAAVTTSTSLSEIVQKRKLTEGTILDHIEKLLQKNELTIKAVIALIPHLTAKQLQYIHAYFKNSGSSALTPAYQYFKGKYTYTQLKMAKMVMK